MSIDVNTVAAGKLKSYAFSVRLKQKNEADQEHIAGRR